MDGSENPHVLAADSFRAAQLDASKLSRTTSDARANFVRAREELGRGDSRNS